MEFIAYRILFNNSWWNYSRAFQRIQIQRTEYKGFWKESILLRILKVVTGILCNLPSLVKNTIRTVFRLIQRTLVLLEIWKESFDGENRIKIRRNNAELLFHGCVRLEDGLWKLITGEFSVSMYRWGSEKRFREMNCVNFVWSMTTTCVKLVHTLIKSVEGGISRAFFNMEIFILSNFQNIQWKSKFLRVI